jgi:hypothetical protein
MRAELRRFTQRYDILTETSLLRECHAKMLKDADDCSPSCSPHLHASRSNVQ